jgi:RimJ/RimL family protein N-acetyltransferase
MLDDAPMVQKLAGDRDIASTTLNIPHPYEDGMAEEWIGTHQEKFEKGELVNFAVVLRGDNQLVGAMGLVINKRHECAELGYWVGKPYWNKGYCTEAAQAVLEYGFNELNLNRIFAHHVKRNQASGRVMQKIGMMHEGCLRQHVKKWDVFEDLEAYAILRSEFTAA